MNREHLGFLHVFDDDLIFKLGRQHVSAMPFARYADDCAAVFSGITTIAKLIALDATIADSEDPAEADFALGVNAAYRLLGLVRVVADKMETGAEDLAQWARDQTEETPQEPGK